MDVLSLTTLLVSVDFTETSLNAVAVAARLGQSASTRLHLIYVPAPAENQGNDTVAAMAASESLPEGTRLIEELAAQTAQTYQIQCSGSCRLGVLAYEVVATAGAVEADLIVMGTQRGGNWQSLRANTAVYEVVKTATCPVLTVPGHRPRTATGRMLFPVRPIPNALDKYEFARKIIRGQATELIVLALFAPDEIISLRQLEEELSALNAKLTQDGVKSRTEFCPTEFIAEAILEKADQLDPDLLIITANTGPDTTDLLSSPFTRDIILNAPVPVLAIQSMPAAADGLVSWHYGLPDS